MNTASGAIAPISDPIKIPDSGTDTAIITRRWGSSDEADETRISAAEPSSMKNKTQSSSKPSSQTSMTAAPTPSVIEQARIDAGLTLEQAEKRTRLKKHTIRQIERGTLRLSLMTLDRLAKGYNCPTGRLLCSNRPRKGRVDTVPTLGSGRAA